MFGVLRPGDASAALPGGGVGVRGTRLSGCVRRFAAAGLAVVLAAIALPSVADAAAPPLANEGGSVAAAPPAAVVGSVTAGYSHTCAITTIGSAACWGDNSIGQSTPLAGVFTAISARGPHPRAVK